jgi:signal transduction histidine kinase
VADALLALALLPLGLATLLIDEEQTTSYRRADVLAVVLVFGLFAALAFRRRFTVPAVFLIVALSLAMWFRGYIDGATAVTGAIVTYTVARHLVRPRSVQVFTAAMVPITAAALWLGMGGSPYEDDVFQGLSRIALTVASYAIGSAVRGRREAIDALRERAEKAEAEQIAQSERAVAEERTKIARDLHDVVAHSLSVMVIQSTAAQRLVNVDPAASATAMQQVTDTGRAALAEMRRIVGALADRDGPVEYRPQPQLADLPELIERVRSGGVSVDLRAHGDVDDIGPASQLAAYRIVQESLTNVLKHAGRAMVTVTVERKAGELTVSVEDDGRGAIATTDGKGRGLIGMRERVEAIGGSFDAGPRRSGGFEVRASIPLDISVSAA